MRRTSRVFSIRSCVQGTCGMVIDIPPCPLDETSTVVHAHHYDSQGCEVGECFVQILKLQKNWSEILKMTFLCNHSQ